MVMSKSYP